MLSCWNTLEYSSLLKSSHGIPIKEANVQSILLLQKHMWSQAAKDKFFIRKNTEDCGFILS